MGLVSCLTWRGEAGALHWEEELLISVVNGQSLNFDVCSEGGLGIEEETERKWDRESEREPLFHSSRMVMSMMIMLMSPWPPTPRASHTPWLIPPPSTHTHLRTQHAQERTYTPHLTQTPSKVLPSVNIKWSWIELEAPAQRKSPIQEHTHTYISGRWPAHSPLSSLA